MIQEKKSAYILEVHPPPELHVFTRSEHLRALLSWMSSEREAFGVWVVERDLVRAFVPPNPDALPALEGPLMEGADGLEPKVPLDLEIPKGSVIEDAYVLVLGWNALDVHEPEPDDYPLKDL